ncbi:kinase-like domain-containing protein [Aspergillus karnatakaensis]|uniref:kinase-like domain-containing protein n=1 Tax=Aspergillus karnatakaensis TaxID=1810916 RepID=UPI003CCD0DC4
MIQLIFNFVLLIFRVLFNGLQAVSQNPTLEPVSETVQASNNPPSPSSPPPILNEDSDLILLEEGYGHRYTALERLYGGLKASRVTGSESHRAFIPNSVLQRLVENNVVDFLREELLVDTDSISAPAQLIAQKAPKLLAALVDIKKQACILQLLREGIQDKDLPFMRVPNPRGPGFTLFTNERQPIQAVKEWDSSSIFNFENKQYRVLSPVFHLGGHYVLNDLHIPPFIGDINSDYKPAAAGGFGEVSQQYIHPDHHRLGDPTTREVFPLAVKRMFHSIDFEAEKKVYDDLGTHNHPHLIKPLFTFQKGDKHHLAFPWADATLQGLWENDPLPLLTRRFLIWTLRQMVGLADALAFFHEFTNPATGRPRFGRHGDIKAQNILWFRDLNVLQLADLGLADIRGRDSRSNVPPSTVKVSPTYSPPEVERNSPVSRKWDNWSLGAVFLEMITYLCLGSDAIATFSKLRTESKLDLPELFSDTFYSSTYEAVKPSVKLWVDRLIQSPRCSNMMYDVLTLIMTEMIVVQSAKRSSAKEVCAKLKAILQRSRRDADYLLKPMNPPHELPSALPIPAIDSKVGQHPTPPWLAASSKSQTWNF